LFHNTIQTASIQQLHDNDYSDSSETTLDVVSMACFMVNVMKSAQRNRRYPQNPAANTASPRN